MSRLHRAALPPLLFLLLWLPLNLWASVDRAASLAALAPILLGAAVFLACLLPLAWLRRTRTARQLWLLLILLCTAFTFASPPFILWKSQFRLFRLPLYDWLRALPIDDLVGQTIHANVIAGALVLLLPLAILPLLWPVLLQTASLAERKSTRILLRALVGLLTLCTLALIVLTQSRGGYLAGVAALIVLLTLRWPRLLYAAPVGVLAAVSIIFWLGPQQLFNLLGADITFGGSQFRVEVWTNALRALRDFAFTGIGFGTFDRVIPLLYPYRTVNGADVPHAHNLVLQIGVDLGLPGLLAWLVLITILFVMAIRVLRHAERTSMHYALAAASLATLVGMLVHGTLDAVTWSSKLAFLPWLIFAQIALVHRPAVFEQQKPCHATLPFDSLLPTREPSTGASCHFERVHPKR